ncbi:hypothetical protein QUF70_20320 [Desulfobacterales bacterium HSG17]|nr:hypothetical protein [Desulfobacterales bacterium HSG17]
MKNENFGSSAGVGSGNFSKNNTKSARPYGDILSGLLREINFSRISWGILEFLFCLIGIGAAFVSFMVEKEVFYQITQKSAFSFWIVLILESAKVLTVIIYGFLFRTKSSEIGFSPRLIIRFFQNALFTLSVICSLALTSFYLDRPNLDKVRSDDVKMIESRYHAKHELIQNRHDADIANLMARTDQKSNEAYKRLREQYEPRINELRAELRMEMDNQVKNDFRGPRYREFEKLLQKYEADYAEKSNALIYEKNALSLKNDTALNREKESLRLAVKELVQWRNLEIKKIRTGRYTDDERANNRLISAVIRTINDGFLSMLGVSVRQVNFTCMFSLLIALLIEITIYASFYSAVLSFSSKLDLMFVMDSSHLDSKKN